MYKIQSKTLYILERVVRVLLNLKIERALKLDCVIMGKHDRCCVGGCNNDKRYPGKYVVRSHVSDLKFHRFTKIEEKRVIWINTINKGLDNFNPGNETFVCSNHFVDGKPTSQNPHPTIFLTPSGYKLDKSPHKRTYLERNVVETCTKRPRESEQNTNSI